MDPTKKLLDAIGATATDPNAPPELRAIANTLLSIAKDATVNTFAERVADEVARARAKFPGAEGMFPALIEEVGEVGTALLSESWEHVIAECVQVAAMAQRLAEEGDDALRDMRSRRGLE